ncbi:MAG: hypothetical protein OK452_04295 [Thaumarchaeota archaeon]|nr:hypothetical protein [Nitrososphaerota archaeon]
MSAKQSVVVGIVCSQCKKPIDPSLGFLFNGLADRTYCADCAVELMVHFYFGDGSAPEVYR